MAIVEREPGESKWSARMAAQYQRIMERSAELHEDVYSITHLAVVLKFQRGEDFVPAKMIEMLKEFSFNLDKAALKIGHSTKEEGKEELKILSLELRSDTFFSYPDIESIKDTVSHESLDLIKEAKRVGADIVLLIKDAYSFTALYGSSRSESDDIVNVFRGLSNILENCATTIHGGDENPFI